jgi:integrase
MARTLHRLSDRSVKAAKAGMHCDGGGLYLQVTAGSDGALRRSWIFRYATGKAVLSRTGKPRRGEREMGLGSYPSIELAAARQVAAEARKLRLQGIDPIEARNDRRAAAAVAEAKTKTFDQCSDAYIEAHRAGWRNAKHAGQWSATLSTYASPVFGALPVATVDTGLVMQVLEPIWTTKPETASRLRGRIESILAWATVRGYRDGANPAQWKNHLDHLLPARGRVRKVAHHAALPYDEMQTFMAALSERPAVTALALRFAILTAARTGEVIGARWGEIDFDKKLWTVPAERMKTGRSHRVPLSAEALAVLKRIGVGRADRCIFPGERGGKLSSMAMLMLLRRMGRGDLTAHGFRSSFRDWAAERTNFPGEVAEAALAHSVGSKVEAAYRRGDLFEKRRRLMDAWGEFCTSEPATGDVVPLKPAVL